MSLFACPICGERLDRLEKAYVCPNGHSYDIASEGYVYLLPPNKKHSKMPGDDKAMVASRRRFLESGCYRIFSDALNHLALKYYPADGSAIVDAGCGEGYYTSRLAEFFSEHGMNPPLCGFDISKFAVKAAAKKYRSIPFAVGSMFGVPVPDSSAGLLTNVFAPIVPEEFARVVEPCGAMILAVPSERHLFGLKQILYEEPYENERHDTEYPGFRFIERVPIRGEIRTDDRQLIRDLFTMTPYFWKTPRAGSERLAAAGHLETEIGFDFLVYKRA
ncbi:putative RNA methyltransferase [Thermocaproicibacter melissae]|uniref:putative RNA methyltransferase n=1 Tax=Thermocaproicibacter melissae TaxID=2966552 RepID=UPI0024B09392|nr:methyltransferase domain-containing protein [Thermocaproicibacter melissae]WBY64155.1 methyltransferase domain-containing protein [Thermocaproicibacter melissae]